MLVSTEEYLAGEPVTLEQCRIKYYDTELKDAEKIQDGNREYPYYMFPENMPELRFIREFLTFMDQHRPAAICKLGAYSLTADYAEECFRR
ncbi:MAG: hypothetical protein K5697_13935 [Lachnospiraceae bacterium]|nr:hypothetical protein [Lachnospiraceae bacterium]